MNIDYSALVMKEAWQAPYLYRQINEHYSEHFTHNGNYPNEGRYTNIVLNLKPIINEERIIEIDYYKKYDMSTAHGKPVLKDAKLTPAEKNKFTHVLELVTVPRAPQLIEAILQKAQKQVDFCEGWNVIKATKSKIFLRDKDGIESSVSMGHLSKALEISHAYFEALDTPEFYYANPSVLSEEEIAPTLALLSLVDVTEYDFFERLHKEKLSRLQDYTDSIGVQHLLDAIAKSDVEAVRKYSAYASKANETNCTEPIIITAVQKQDPEIVQILVDNHVDLFATIEITEKKKSTIWKTAFHFALELELWDILSILARGREDKNKPCLEPCRIKPNFDYQMALLLARNGLPFYIGDLFDSLSNEQVSSLAPYECIYWRVNHFQRMYEAGDEVAVKHMLKTSWLGEDVLWIISTKRLDLMKFYVNTVKIKRKAFQLAGLLDMYKRNIIYMTLRYPTEWRDYVEACYIDQNEYEKALQDAYITCIKLNDIDGCYILVNEYKTLPKYKVLSTAVRESREPRSDALLEFLLDYYIDEDDEEHQKQYHFGALNLFYEAIIPASSYALCKKLMEKYPLLLKEPVCAEHIWNYLDKRSKWDSDCEVQHLAESMGLIAAQKR